MWNRIKVSPRKTAKSSVSGLSDPKARFDVTKDACSELLKQIKAEIRQYDSVCQSLLTLMDVFHEESGDSVCIRYFVSQECWQLLCSRFKEFPCSVLPRMCALIRNIMDNDQSGIVSRDKNFVLGVTAWLRAMISCRIDRHCEETFSELLFVISSKLRKEPQGLVKWFQLLGILERQQSKLADYPLFSLLLDYIYHEGKVGEYARTGLLYLIEVISSSEELERWMIKSDLSTLMASGLGALYSQLNRGVTKSSLLLVEEPPIIALSNDSRMKHELSIANSQISLNENPVPVMDPESKHNMVAFLSYLQFWQDMITHCQSEKLADCLLGHFDILFLRQLLYPSLIQSTDNEGGYSVSVLTVLRLILQILEHNQLSQLIICYFLGIPLSKDYAGAARASQGTVDALLSGEDGNPLLTLKDVVFSGLESANPQMVTATLQLLSCLMRKYFPYVQGTLLTVTLDHQISVPYQVVSRELKILRNILTDLEQNGHMPLGEYESDMELRILNTPFLLPGQSVSLLPDEQQRLDATNNSLLARVGISLKRHKVRPEDRLMERVFQLFCKYYGNATEVNLALTGFLVDLGSSCWTSLREWALSDGHIGTKINDKDILNNCKFLRILKDLADQYQHYSVIVDQFDSGLLEFEQNLKVGHDINDALNVGPDGGNLYERNGISDDDDLEDTDEENSDGHSEDAVNNDNFEDDENERELMVTPTRSIRRSLSSLTLGFRSQSRSSSRPKSSPKVTDQFGTLPRRLVSKALNGRSIGRTSDVEPDRNSPATILFSQGVGSGADSRHQRRSDPFMSDTLLSKIASKVQLIPGPSDEIFLPLSARLVHPESAQVPRISLSQLFGNIIILREFVKEIEALVRVRAWLVESNTM